MKKTLLLGAALASTTLATACGPGGLRVPSALCGQAFYTIQVSRQNIGINERVPISVAVNNPCNHDLEYRFVAARGTVLSQNPLLPMAEYIAPFTGGEDRIIVSVYNRSENTNLPQQQAPLLVMGDGLAYVEAPAAGTELDAYDNGVIKVTGIQGAGVGSQAQQVAIGRQPTISPDGRFIAYTYFPGDGTSQIRVQDAAGNVTILTGNGGSFNRDPAWAPIGSDLNQHLVFSSDRLSTSSGQAFNERGEAFNIWRVSALGQNLQQLSSTPGNDRQPTWSPDGRVIIYQSNFSQNQIQNYSNLWRLDLTSGRLLQLTYETAPDKGAFEPTFSPDGQRIAYSRKYIARQTGSGSQRDYQKIWLVDLNTIDIPSLQAFLPPGQGGVGTIQPGQPLPGTNPNVPETAGNREGNFGNIATQEFDEGTIETTPSFSVDGRWITYVRTRGDDIRTVSIPGNPGTLGTIGFEPLNVLPAGSERAIEARWARQSQSFNRF